ncbi:hypothetical protein [Aphanothece sacrum]|uniref:Uncharacterized protein n=1 Tax=Aphanothece sacrum FPU1 TaxID=1920663 RepID=A0A401IF65_APHSA|nr:hypothetical protein [Aphanothece sacrum]GBF79856.1 hypothetical protein AsFPU1_1256 [Aphanothece sacrum FPU1]GBF86342.1 Hypothetical protein AsFPU3_3413 [Aphanothece sacrum FPU3]
MAKNTGKGYHHGSLDKSSPAYNPKTEQWAKRDAETGRFMDVEQNGEPFKSIRNLKTSLNEYLEQLSETNLQIAYQFIADLVEKEREEATVELLEIPDLLEDIELAKQDIAQGELTDWREIRQDV